MLWIVAVVVLGVSCVEGRFEMRSAPLGRKELRRPFGALLHLCTMTTKESPFRLARIPPGFSLSRDACEPVRPSACLNFSSSRPLPPPVRPPGFQRQPAVTTSKAPATGQFKRRPPDRLPNHPPPTTIVTTQDRIVCCSLTHFTPPNKLTLPPHTARFE